MAEASQIVFNHKEVVEALIKKEGIHEGIWGLYIRFAIQAANVAFGSADLLPAAIVPVVEIGLQKFEEVNNLSVDAAKVNPKQTAGKPKK
ncbi:MAG: hypothetical protein JST85_00165 [Acidobacteria bacterium]|nr:hypothetical protein [Acidobacteriota bacterium]